MKELLLANFEMGLVIYFLVGLVLALLFKKESFLEQFKGFETFEIIWISIFFVSLMYINYLWDENLFGIFVSVAGILCVVLVAKGNIWNYFWGIINVSGYAFIAYSNNYAGDFVLNVMYYLPMQFIGYYMWQSGLKGNSQIIRARKFTLDQFVISVISLGAVTYGIGKLMPYVNSLFGMESNPLPFVDAFTTAGSVFAMFLMVRRFKEQWTLWIIVNSLSIYMWYTMGDMVMVAMWTAYLVNAMYGHYNWDKLEKKL